MSAMPANVFFGFASAMHARGGEEDAEGERDPARGAVRQPGDDELLHGAEQEHEADDHADGLHRRLVELQHRRAPRRSRSCR